MADSTTSPLLSVPADVVLLVTDHLGLRDKVFLSQTSRALRNIIGSDSKAKLGKLPDAEKLEFWHAIAHNRTDKWVCGHCHWVHDVDASDTPHAPRPPCAAEMSQAGEYKLHDHHVQLALKFDRLQEDVPYKQKLLKGCTQVFADPASSSKRTRRVRPKIVNGQFVVYREDVFERDAAGQPFYYQQLAEPYSGLCPHRFVAVMRSIGVGVPGTEAWPSGVLDEPQIATVEALARPGFEIRGSCPLCPTDYSVEVENERKVVFRSWHDFGSSSAPLDQTWRSHAVPKAEWTDIREVPLRAEDWPEVYHEPGSARELYEAGDC
ncbi:hypothetical protein ACJ41O_001145 [Fusarium nematophilum]